VRLLKEGLPRLWNGHGFEGRNEEFICHTFDRWDECTPAIREMISARLYDKWHRTYHDWADRSKTMNKFTKAEIQDGRKRWMLDLIAEFS
jgi:hypothetical protein